MRAVLSDIDAVNDRVFTINLDDAGAVTITFFTFEFSDDRLRVLEAKIAHVSFPEPSTRPRTIWPQTAWIRYRST